METERLPLVECNMKDLFNVGFLLLIAGIITSLIRSAMPVEPRVYGAETQIAGLLIISYTAMKFYKAGREGR